jgi:DnaJ-class molecular chaperone
MTNQYDESLKCETCNGMGGQMVDSLGQPYWENCDDCKGFGFYEEPPK